MDFREGGYRRYAMMGPEGERHEARTDYLSIVHHQSFTGTDSFCDETGSINTDLPTSKFQNKFAGNSEKTTVTILSEYASEEHLKQVIEMGMKDGLAMAFTNLDQYLTHMQQAPDIR